VATGEKDFSALVREWATAEIASTLLAGRNVSDIEIKALRAQLVVWCKGKIPSTAQAAMDWIRSNVSIAATENADGEITGMKFRMKK
jgi:hypothetical protein